MANISSLPLNRSLTLLLGCITFHLQSSTSLLADQLTLPAEFVNHFQIAQLEQVETKQKAILVARLSNDYEDELFELGLKVKNYQPIQSKKLRLSTLVNLSSKALSVLILGYWGKEFLYLESDRKRSAESFRSAQEEDLKNSSEQEVRAWNARQVRKKRTMITTLSLSSYTLLGHLLKPTFGAMDAYQKIFFLEGWENASRANDVAREIARHVESHSKEKIFLFSVDLALFERVKNKLENSAFSEIVEREKGTTACLEIQ